MSDFLSIFGAYDFVVRDGLISCLVALAIYVLLSAGIFAIPQVGLMSVGAYISAYFSLHVGTPLVLSILVGGVGSAIVGLGLAALLARLDGIYLAIASIAFSEVVRVAVIELPGLGHAEGLVGLPRGVTDVQICLTVAIAVVALVALRRSRQGLAIAAMRVDGLMARHQGVNTTRLRTALFGLSGLLAGTAGGLHVHLAGFVEPNQFDFDMLTQLLAIVVIGGMLYVAGSFVGALVIIGLPQFLTGLSDYEALVNGAIIVAVVAFAPGGIIGVLARLARSRLLTPSPAGEVRLRAVEEDAPAASPTGDLVLDVSDLHVTFGGVRAVDGVTLQVRAGEILGVIGPNGSGKTTLINALSGVYRPSAGSGTIGGRDLRRLWGQPHLLARSGVARTFQTIRLVEDATSVANVAVGVRTGSARQTHTTARGLLSRLGLAPVGGTRVGDLPYGLRREVEIARALASEPRLLLLDEPTAGMSPVEREQVFQVVAGARRRGVAVLLIEHDVALMRQFCDRLLVLNFGRTLAQGDPDAVLESKEVRDAYVGSGSYA